MKKLIPLLLAAAVSLLAVGCVAPKEGAPTAGPVIDEQTLADAAIVLRAASRSAAVLAIQDNPENEQYVKIAVAAMETLLLEGNYLPGQLVNALSPVLEDVSDPKIALAINTVLDIYEIFYGRYVKEKVGDSQAAQFLRALHDGAASALAIANTPPPLPPAQLP